MLGSARRGLIARPIDPQLLADTISIPPPVHYKIMMCFHTNIPLATPPVGSPDTLGPVDLIEPVNFAASVSFHGSGF